MAYLPKSKPSFFGDSSNGKKAFPGKFKGPKQKKQMKRSKVKRKKQMAVKTPVQIKTQLHTMAPRRRQEYLVPTPRQPHRLGRWDDENFMRRLRRATS